MDLLSLVGMATKRRSDYITQAKDLASKYKTQPNLEEQMAKQSKLLVVGLRDKQMRWEEYERSMLDKTLIYEVPGAVLNRFAGCNLHQIQRWMLKQVIYRVKKKVRISGIN